MFAGWEMKMKHITQYGVRNRWRDHGSGSFKLSDSDFRKDDDGCQ